MRVLHTSDWHLGKSLEGFSRMEEQRKFCSDFIEVVEKNNIDMVVIAGDVFDTANPPAQAEQLFYETLVKLSDKGRRYVFVIAGNHDSPEKLESINPLVEGLGITILGYPLSQAKIGRYDGFEIIESHPGFTKVRIGEERINIASLPYPSEKRLNEAIDETTKIEKMQASYSGLVGNIFENLEGMYREDEINIAVSHIFVVGSDTSDSERRIELGGSLLVEKSSLPKKSQYTALGHIHKPQRASKERNAYYSGSPLQYSKSEASTAKSVNIVELKAGEEPKVSQVFINTYKPIQTYRLDSIDEAKELSDELKEKDIYAYFEILIDDIVPGDDIRHIKSNMKSIVEIKPIIKSSMDVEPEEIEELNSNNVSKYFVDFYRESTDGLQPSEGVLELFNELLSEVMV